MKQKSTNSIEMVSDGEILINWPTNDKGDFICNKNRPMPLQVRRFRWEHDDVRETDYDGEYSIEYKCHSCGHIWRSEMPD